MRLVLAHAVKIDDGLDALLPAAKLRAQTVLKRRERRGRRLDRYRPASGGRRRSPNFLDRHDDGWGHRLGLDGRATRQRLDRTRDLAPEREIGLRQYPPPPHPHR